MSTKTSKNKLFLKLKDFWLKYEAKIVLVFGLILVSAISFEAGLLKGQKSLESTLVIEKPAECKNVPDTGQNTQKTQNLTSETVSTKIGEETPQSSSKDCVFVGSKNSNKYYPPTCSFAKRIKPENIVCFKDDQDAQSKGYQRSESCFK